MPVWHCDWRSGLTYWSWAASRPTVRRPSWPQATRSPGPIWAPQSAVLSRLGSKTPARPIDPYVRAGDPHARPNCAPRGEKLIAGDTVRSEAVDRRRQAFRDGIPIRYAAVVLWQRRQGLVAVRPLAATV